MKNYSFLVSLFLLLFTGCQKEDVKNSLFYNVLHGNVKSVLSKTFEAKEIFGEVKKGELLFDESFSNAKYEFDENGMLISAIEYGGNGEVSRKQVFEVDNYKILSQSNYDSDGFSKIVYTYDGDIETEQIEYNIEGNILSKWEFQNDGKNITKKEEYKYRFSPSGKDDRYLYMVIDYKYVDGKLSSSIQWNKYVRYNTKYEWNGEFHSKVIHDDYSTEITRNQFGHFLNLKNGRRENTVDDEFSSCDGWNYDYTYEYDEHNNWIKCIEYNTDECTPTKIIERKIEYYK